MNVKCAGLMVATIERVLELKPQYEFIAIKPATNGAGDQEDQWVIWVYDGTRREYAVWTFIDKCEIKGVPCTMLSKGKFYQHELPDDSQWSAYNGAKIEFENRGKRQSQVQ